jgi:hypothetical protein
MLLTAVFLASPCLAGYIDVPIDHYARQAIDELVEVGILPPGEGKLFHGERLINRYLLTNFITQIIEQIVVGEEGELELANPSRGYRDVPLTNFAYRSIQKLIALGVIPPGDKRELFYGNRKITRYQMVYFTFSAIEHVLSDVMDFQTADPAFGYGDVPPKHFVYDAIQKLVWLGVLEGGKPNKFYGKEYVDRYELCYFSVNLVKAIYLKLREAEVVLEKPVRYGFKVFSKTGLSVSQIEDGKAPGEDLWDIYANQRMSISIDRSLSKILSFFASFTSRYYFGDALRLSSSYVDHGYFSIYNPPFVLQAGRTDYYQGFTPFGNSIYIDTVSSDMILGGFSHSLFNLTSGVGKLAYVGDVSLDSNFGFLSLAPRMPKFLNWLDISLGGSFINNLPDPAFTSILTADVAQVYGGLRINLFNLLEFSAETAKLDFSDRSVLPTIGHSTKEGFEASQFSLTYFSEDYGYIVSLGYQKIGDDYYLSTLADPTILLSTKYDNIYLTTGQNTESFLVKGRFFASPSQILGADFVYVLRDGSNYKTGMSGSYDFELFDSANLNLSVTKIMYTSKAYQDRLNLSSSLSISF